MFGLHVSDMGWELGEGARLGSIDPLKLQGVFLI